MHIAVKYNLTAVKVGGAALSAKVAKIVHRVLHDLIGSVRFARYVLLILPS
ncbi:MAG TPA: hypothetical protein VGO47_08525 [Chlamydiales bacterium]|nr:hypothetical protein [Chlamydiales bacterium]